MPVYGEGPTPCSVMLVGEAFGYHEQLHKRPFYVDPDSIYRSGKSALELTRMLGRAHLPREQCYLTNLVNRQPPMRNGKQLAPTAQEIENELPRLIEELQMVRPRWIGAIGRHAARVLTGEKIEMEWGHAWGYGLSKQIRAALRDGAVQVQEQSRRDGRRDVQQSDQSRSSVLQGLQGVSELAAGERCTQVRSGSRRRQQVQVRSELGRSSGESLCAWYDECVVIPLYHPAAGLHNSQVARFVWFDIAQFAKYVRGEAHPVNPTDQYPSPIYSIAAPFNERAPAYGIDTEGSVDDPWSIQISTEPGTAAAIIRDDHQHDAVLPSINSKLHVVDAKLIGHNWLHDWHVCRALGIDIDSIDFDRIEDTMLMSFCIGSLPIGLKALSRRLTGAIQKSYPEAIAPAERKLALSYITKAIDAKVCRTCNGTGKVAAYGKTGAKRGQLLKRQDKCPNPLCIDGGLWSAREGQLAYDWSDGTWSMKAGWQIQRYLRSLKADIESGKFDVADDDDAEELEETDSTGESKPRTIRQRWESWDDDVREPVEELLGPMPTPTLRDVPRKDAEAYACRDADLTLRNFPILDRMIDESDLRDAYRLDLSITPACAEMERNGMAVDVDALEKLGRRLRRENDVILRKIQNIAHRPINPRSGDQVAALLFGDRRLTYNEDDERELLPQLSFGLESRKRTRSGKRAAVDEKVLQGLLLKYAERPEVVEIVRLLIDYNTRYTLDRNFVSKIPRIAKQQKDGHWRVYTHLRQTVAATYRLASGDPINLQNIPVRSKGDVDLGKLVRACFIAAPGCVLAGSDYSQVELRILAALSGDDNLLRAFREGLDPHILGASRAWRMDYDEMLAAYRAGDGKIIDIRESAKNLNFGIVFGITPRGLQAQMELRGLRYTLDECADLIRMWTKEAFPGIGAYIEEVHSYGRMHGYAKSLMGHMRHCPGVWSDIPSIREEALRQLVNFTVQCSAAEVLKAGLRDLWRRGKKALDRVGTKLTMSVHDENLADVPDNDEAREVSATVIETYMENPIELPNGVEIKTKLKFAQNWAALKAA